MDHKLEYFTLGVFQWRILVSYGMKINCFVDLNQRPKSPGLPLESELRNRVF